MNLSYTLRLLSVLVVVAGLVQAAGQLAMTSGARLILRRLESASARRREGILYLIQIGPAFLAVFVAAALCLPAYLCFEPIHTVESVSFVCVLLAGGLGLWFASGLLRGLRTSFRTLRFIRACRRSGEILALDGVVPVLVVPDLGYPVALVGFLRPRVFVSADFVRMAQRLDPDALTLALAHEQSHATHRDNWKLLLLCFLPRLDRLIPGGAAWRQLWQSAADWAADDDAVQGDPARSLLLAEVLVQAAQCVCVSRLSILCTALTSAEAGLAARVDRLTHPRLESPADDSLNVARFAFLALLATGVILTLYPGIYSLAERLLHLGTG
jgi:Zn-dependent protease with chaperone function